MNNKKTVLPKHRFPEFNSCHKWEITTLGEISEPIDEKVGSKNCILMSVTAGKGLVPQKEKFGREIAGNSYRNYYVVRKNDFAYNKSATKQFPEGYIAMLEDYDEAALPNSIFTCFRITDKECVPAFINQLFQSNYHGKWLRKYIEVGARAHGSLNIDCNYLWNMPIALPRKKEQEKVALVLTEFEELICKETSKLKMLQKHKKGLLTKLVPKQGESVPEWRFNANLNVGKWETTTLGSIGTFIRGLTYSSNDVVKNGMLVLRSGNIQNHQIVFDDLVFVDKKTADEFQLKKNDVIICMSNGSKKLVGKTAEYVGNYDKPITVGAFCSIFRSENPLAKYFFQTESYNKYISNKIEGGNINNLKNSDLETFGISIPKNPRELEKIVETLLSIDNLILLQTDRINMLKRQKDGLIQNLFPSFEEVSKQI